MSSAVTSPAVVSGSDDAGGAPPLGSLGAAGVGS
jgi:hypothetical protein